MQNDNTYQAYSMELVKDVPGESLNYLVKIFMDKAAMNMGSDYKDNTLRGSVEIIKTYFSYIPIHYIASGFIKGSLGDYDSGRLTPRTVKNWMGHISLEYNRDNVKDIQKQKLNDVSIVMNLHKYPIGSAICKKIEWQKKGILDINDWDKVPLKELAEMIGAGHIPTLEKFGIEQIT